MIGGNFWAQARRSSSCLQKQLQDHKLSFFISERVGCIVQSKKSLELNWLNSFSFATLIKILALDEKISHSSFTLKGTYLPKRLMIVSFGWVRKGERIKIYSFLWVNPGLYWLFPSFSRYKFNNTNWKKRRWCAWDSNPGPQDGRLRRNHGAMATAHSSYASFFTLGLNGATVASACPWFAMLCVWILLSIE